MLTSKKARSFPAVSRLSRDNTGENLDNVDANPSDLVGAKPNTCLWVRSIMTQAELDSLVSEGCFSADAYHGKRKNLLRTRVD
jgi:hypothetical protein